MMSNNEVNRKLEGLAPCWLTNMVEVMAEEDHT